MTNHWQTFSAKVEKIITNARTLARHEDPEKVFANAELAIENHAAVLQQFSEEFIASKEFASDTAAGFRAITGNYISEAWTEFHKTAKTFGINMKLAKAS